MIEVSNIRVAGWDAAIEGMRNPLNSWDKSDSYYGATEYEDGSINWEEERYYVGANDMDLMKRLFNAGTEHRKFMRFIDIWVTVKAPLYWWKEADTYHFMDRNSCSTMHKITSKRFEPEDFALDHITGEALPAMNKTIWTLNRLRDSYLESKDKEVWYSIIQLLPSSYMQQSTLKFNYETAANMIRQRKNHKLDEWHVFCDALLNKCPYLKELVEG